MWGVMCTGNSSVSAKYEECFNTLPVPTTDSDCPHRADMCVGMVWMAKLPGVAPQSLMAIFG